MNRYLLIGLLCLVSIFTFAQYSFETILKNNKLNKKVIISIEEWNGNYILAG